MRYAAAAVANVNRARAISGDVALAASERRRYLARGLREVVGAAGEWRAVGLLPLRLDDRAVRAAIEDGASPFRVYTSALAARIALAHARTDRPVCDIGCGSGAHARFFEAAPGGALYLGIDITARPHWRNAGPRRFVRMSATRLALAPKSVGFTFSSSVLEHIDDVETAVREMADAMASGSHGLHVVPSVWALFLYLFHGYRRFSRDGLVKLFERNGLEVVATWSLGGLVSFVLHGVWITWLKTGLVFDWIAVARVPGVLRRACSLYLVRRRLDGGRPLRLYARLLSAALWLDRFLPALPVGYGILVRKP